MIFANLYLNKSDKHHLISASLTGITVAAGRLQIVNTATLILLKGPFEGIFLLPHSICLLFLIVTAGKSQSMPVLKIELRELECVVLLPVSQADDMGQLLGGEQDTEDTLEYGIFLHQTLIQLINFLPLLLVLIFKLEDLLGRILVLPAQIRQKFPHFFHFLLQVGIVFLHVCQLLFSLASFMEQFLRQLAWGN